MSTYIRHRQNFDVLIQYLFFNMKKIAVNYQLIIQISRTFLKLIFLVKISTKDEGDSIGVVEP